MLISYPLGAYRLMTESAWISNHKESYDLSKGHTSGSVLVAKFLLGNEHLNLKLARYGSTACRPSTWKTVTKESEIQNQTQLVSWRISELNFKKLPRFLLYFYSLKHKECSTNYLVLCLLCGAGNQCTWQAGTLFASSRKECVKCRKHWGFTEWGALRRGWCSESREPFGKGKHSFMQIEGKAI